jgi:energy-coupling factor transporter ATP-binding protein EcfA2
VKLIEFQISNYRSINDSGPIKVGKITSLVGRNESGKSNLLLALQTLNPAGGPKDLAPIKNFPRHRKLSECTDETPVVSSTWELDPTEQTELSAMFPRAAGVTQVNIGRRYRATSHWVEFVELKSITFSADEIAARLRKIRPVVEVEADKLEETPQGQLKTALEALEAELKSAIEPTGGRPLRHQL